MPRFNPLHLLLTAGLWLAAAPVLTAAPITTTRVAADLQYPVFVTAPPDDPARLFILEQNGRILILKDGLLLPVPFLDIDALVPDISANDERGLLGLAFHPDYAVNGMFYVYYTNLDNDTVVARYQVSADPDLADPGSGSILLVIDQPFGNHNGGTIAFGPQDGFLYIGLGDGGSAGDPGDRAQDDGTLLGKMLRIDVDTGVPYGIPAGNPFVGPDLPLDEIWAKGLRNPYRWSFDRLTGDLYIADVGQWDWEEVNVQAAAAGGGQNYGWRLMEGLHCYNPPADCNDGTLSVPVFEYSHDDGCSITGGYVYRGGAIPDLQGHYFFADFCSHRIWSFRIVGGQVTDLQDRTDELNPGDTVTIRNIASFGEDGLGELYIVDRTVPDQGEVHKIVPGPVDPTAKSSWGGLKAGYR